MQYKKFGYKTSFYYKFINVSLDIVNASSRLYHTIELRQIEVNDDATGPVQLNEGEEQYTATFGMITSFLFESTKDIIRTLAVIVVFLCLILLWMDVIFRA